MATGGKPRVHPSVSTLSQEEQKNISTYRYLSDFRKLHSIASEGKHIVVIGGGFLGSELSCALAEHSKKVQGLKVTQVFPEEGNMALAFPSYLSKWTTKKVQEAGVQVKSGMVVTGFTAKEGGGVKVHFSNGDSIEADHVVTALGIEPNVELAKLGNLEVDNVNGGIVVNSELEARKNVFSVKSSYLTNIKNIKI